MADIINYKDIILLQVEYGYHSSGIAGIGKTDELNDPSTPKEKTVVSTTRGDRSVL